MTSPHGKYRPWHSARSPAAGPTACAMAERMMRTGRRISSLSCPPISTNASSRWHRRISRSPSLKEGRPSSSSISRPGVARNSACPTRRFRSALLWGRETCFDDARLRPRRSSTPKRGSSCSSGVSGCPCGGVSPSSQRPGSVVPTRGMWRAHKTGNAISAPSPPRRRARAAPPHPRAAGMVTAVGLDGASSAAAMWCGSTVFRRRASSTRAANG